MVSDELRTILKATAHHQDLYLWKACRKLLRPIIALERCRELLAKHHWVEHDAQGEDGRMTWCICCDGDPPHHAPDCEIAKALEATHDPAHD